MPNYLHYQKSISDEIISVKNRVRNFIDNNHWGEDGRYKEIILADIIKKQMPNNISVGTGFVMCSLGNGQDRITSQIDIIVYDNNFPILFSVDNFVIVPQDSVLGIIEVKTNLNHQNFNETVKKAHQNAEMISLNFMHNKMLFNGIFSYESKLNFKNGLSNTVKSTMQEYSCYVNYISFGKDFFMKFWKSGNPEKQNIHSHYSFYEMEDLSFGYFISNLIEIANRRANHNDIPFVNRRMFYPIEESKESKRLNSCEIVLY